MSGVVMFHCKWVSFVVILHSLIFGDGYCLVFYHHKTLCYILLINAYWYSIMRLTIHITHVLLVRASQLLSCWLAEQLLCSSLFSFDVTFQTKFWIHLDRCVVAQLKLVFCTCYPMLTTIMSMCMHGDTETHYSLQQVETHINLTFSVWASWDTWVVKSVNSCMKDLCSGTVGRQGRTSVLGSLEHSWNETQ